MSAYDAMQRPSVANDVNFQPPDDLGDDESDPFDAIMAVQNYVREVAEPLLHEESFHKQEADEFRNYVQSVIEGGATSVYTEEADSGLLLRTLHRPRPIALSEILRLRVLNLYHQPVTAGHPGARKMYMTMRQTFYWTGMAPACYAYLRQCPECGR